MLKETPPEPNLRPRVTKKRRNLSTTRPETQNEAFDVDKLRLERLNDVQLDALKVRDALQGTLKGAAGDLLFLAFKLKRAIAETLDETGGIVRFDATVQLESNVK